MAGKYGVRPQDVIHTLQLQITDLQRQINMLKNAKSVSVPIIDLVSDSGELPGRLLINKFNGFLGYTRPSDGITVGPIGRRDYWGEGNVTQGTTATVNVLLENHTNYILSVFLIGPNQEINNIYAVNCSINNINIGKTVLSAKNYNLGTFVIQTQNNGADFAFNASSANTVVLKFTAATTGSGGGDAVYRYTFIAIGRGD
jgi:hypothetical protein